MHFFAEQPLTHSTYPLLQLPDVHVVHEKGSGEANEDLLLIEEGLYGVFDGATALSSTCRDQGRTGGYIAAALAAETFRQNGHDLQSCLVESNNRLRVAQERAGCSSDERYGLWSTSLAVVRFSAERLEYCSLGDASILLLTDDGSHRLLTPEMDIDRETLSMWKAYSGEKCSIYEVLAEQIRKVRSRMNIDYGVLNGESAALNFVQSGSVSLADVTDVLLFTDGLLIPRENPKAPHDWRSFVDLYQAGGLKAVRDHVRNIERQDPDTQRYPRFKTHDDIAAVSINCCGSIQPGRGCKDFSSTTCA